MLEFSQEFFKARMLKPCILMDNKFLYCGIEKQTPCFYSSLYLSVYRSIKAKFVSQFFSGTVQARIFKCGTYICRMSDCIVGLRLRIMAFIFQFLSVFLSFPI